MASQIYARYIPPAKSSRGIAVEKASLLSDPDPSPIASVILARPPTQHDASATYVRYVPPASKSKSVPPIPTPILNEAPPWPPKRKHSDLGSMEGASPKAKKSKNGDGLTGLKLAKLPITHDTFDALPVSPGGETLEHPKRRKNKSKEFSVAHDDGGNSHHKAILEKKAISMKKAEKKVRKEAHKWTQEQPQAEADAENTEEAAQEPFELHSLEPLPQPEPVQPSTQTFEALPEWIVSPIRISSTTKASFSDLGIAEGVIRSLQASNFQEAFAVQAAVLPLLLPGTGQKAGDVLVSAATGSGKTLAYVLPMVEDLSKSTVPRLRGLIVMPTRELVTQAREVCEMCAKAYRSGDGRRRLQIGIAVGNQSLKAEQTSLMNSNTRYKPQEYELQIRKSNAKWESSDDEGNYEMLYTEEAEAGLPRHVTEYSSKVDILICTPGRLVEHLKSTNGFVLDFLKWLVIDEADKLLDQSFQQWLDVVMAGVPDRKSMALHERREIGVRKVVLSATMTRDIGQLSLLKLYRPKLVVLEGADAERAGGEVLSLPDSLSELGVKVEDPNDKPLYLLELLQSSIWKAVVREEDADFESGDSESTSNSDTSISDKGSSVSSVASLDDTLASTTDLSARGLLVFTKSNENAVRLSRLIALMAPSMANSIGTLTSTTEIAARKATLRGFNSGRVSLIVASDLVSRGLDLPNLGGVINYDMPSSLNSYVHRVGRTARAGKGGKAWTLFTPTEARWFWHEIARSKLVQRGERKIQRLNIAATAIGDKERERYENALKILESEASGRKD